VSAPSQRRIFSLFLPKASTAPIAGMIVRNRNAAKGV
jgi:hypothetical protein